MKCKRYRKGYMSYIKLYKYKFHLSLSSVGTINKTVLSGFLPTCLAISSIINGLRGSLLRASRTNGRSVWRRMLPGTCWMALSHNKTQTIFCRALMRHHKRNSSIHVHTNARCFRFPNGNFAAPWATYAKCNNVTLGLGISLTNWP